MAEEVRKDLQWWTCYLDKCNGASIMWMNHRLTVDEIIVTDACLQGIGGFCQGRYFHATIPEWISSLEDLHIAHLELWAIVVAVQLWRTHINGLKFVVGCDNESVMTIINTGYSRDKLLQILLRELMYHLAMGHAEMVAKFVPGHDNIVPDLLLRWTINDKYEEKFLNIKEPMWEEDVVATELFTLRQKW